VGQVAITLNARTYRLRCGDGEEPRLLALAAHLRAKVDGLVGEFGQIGEERLLLMAALLVADELFEARDRNSAPSEDVA
jgi:cell division protein ZapA